MCVYPCKFVCLPNHSMNPPLQVDFPSPAVDVLYVGPQESPCPDPNTLEELDPDLRRRVEKLCSRASTFGYCVCCHDIIHEL